MTGELKQIAEFQQAFPRVSRDATRLGTPGVSALEPIAQAGLATGGAIATGNPAGMLAGGIPLLREPARALLMSKPYQSMMAQPNYQAPMMTGGGPLLPANDPKMAELIRALSLPAAVNQ